MTRTRATAVALLAATLAVTGTGCSKRQIDPAETGSVKIQGTSWMQFCDGPNAVIWVPGHSGDADELEAYVYDHHACAPAFYGEQGPANPEARPQDGDGISEEDE